jgi:hypothetical protein
MRARPAATMFGAAALALSVGEAASAGTIAIVSEVTATAGPGGLSVSARITNKGDEAAQRVVSTMVFDGREVQGPTRAILGPRDVAETAAQFVLGDRRGQWPLLTRVDYTDGNGHPFQALQVAIVSTPASTPALAVVVDVEAAPLKGTTEIRARLKSLSEVELPALVRFHGPMGLDISPARASLRLGPWADAAVSAAIVDRGASIGSRYPVFVTLEYDEAGQRHTAVGQAVVVVQEPSHLSGPPFFPIAAGLILIWGAAVLVRRRRRGAEGPPAP